MRSLVVAGSLYSKSETNQNSTNEVVKDLSSNMKSRNRSRMIRWRRNKILELSSHGQNQTEIADILKISEPTVSRDLSYLKNQAKSNIKDT
jgi:DNA-binding NarL/FixJ family response regulator